MVVRVVLFLVSVVRALVARFRPGVISVGEANKRKESTLGGFGFVSGLGLGCFFPLHCVPPL